MDNFVFGRTIPIKQKYTIGRQLGQPGQYGIALEATENSTKKKYAVKVISKARFLEVKDKDRFFKMLKQEIEIMTKLSHKNIIRLHEVLEENMHLYLVMEKCSGGELFDRIQKRGSYSESDASNVLRQITEAISYLHRNNVAHCDLKPDNFLFETKSEDSVLKVIDFGMSKIVKPRKHLRQLCGTPYYVAPEVIQGRYNNCCDMWSIGVIAFVLVFGFPPFWVDPGKYGRKADAAIFNLITKGFLGETKKGYGPFFPEDIPASDSVKDFISKLLVTDVAERLTAEEALEHPWLKGESASEQPLPASVFEAFKSFHNQNKFRTAVLGKLSENLSEERLKELKDAFMKMDANGDGTITFNELSACLSNEQYSATEIKSIMLNLDTDGDGVICYEELVRAAVLRQISSKEERMCAAFRTLDTNGDGSITASELKQVLGNEDATELIKDADTNNDGVVDYNEFLKIFDKAYDEAD